MKRKAGQEWMRTILQTAALAICAIATGTSGGAAMQDPMKSGLRALAIACSGSEHAESLCMAVADAMAQRLGVPVSVTSPQTLPRNDAKSPMTNTGWVDIDLPETVPGVVTLSWGSAANRRGISQGRGRNEFMTNSLNPGDETLVKRLIEATPFH